MEPKTKKTRSENRIAKIATFDNDTAVEVFKYLNYSGLAKNSLVSKRFCDLIRTNRHRLALLYVDSIYMQPSINDPAAIKMFDKELSPEEYNEWVARSNYSKQISLEGQTARDESTQYEYTFYHLGGHAFYKDPSHRAWEDDTCTFFARAEFNHENWPLFQHFVCLLTDPFIYIRCMTLTAKIDVLNLTKATNPDHRHLKCEELVLFSNYANLEDNVQKHFNWIKNNVRCNKFEFLHNNSSTHDEELFDLFMTGALCTSAIKIKDCDVSKVIIDFVQRFMDLKEWDENQMVETIYCDNVDHAIEALKRNYAEFHVGVRERDYWDCYDYELINEQIAKKLKLNCYTDFDPNAEEGFRAESFFHLNIKDLNSSIYCSSSSESDLDFDLD